MSTQFTPLEYWTGWGQIIRNSFHGLLLDEATGWASFALVKEYAFVTKQMVLMYIRLVHVDQPIMIYGHVVRNIEQEIHVRGEIRNDAGRLLTESMAVHFKLKPDIFQKSIG